MYPGQKAIHSNLGHLLWRLQSMEGISIGNEKMSAFLHYLDAMILPLTASSTKDVPDLNEWPLLSWIHV